MNHIVFILTNFEQYHLLSNHHNLLIHANYAFDT